ncbi:MAG TPA: toxin TcdB middle/N-terminal domain-containing protein, partial [Verrucomicrobiae bacterium]|nr:toxin TcdB middle/N-terminal domain-containing protein [Verrucomicrobiae bacterium]
MVRIRKHQRDSDLGLRAFFGFRISDLGLAFFALAVVALATVSTSPLLAADKNGVSPNTISLPTGPGSLEGLGESFQPALNTGLGRYRVPLTIPPGPAGSAPSLALAYEGGNGNGTLGFGWSLPLPFVQRQTDHGIPRYVDATNEIDDDRDGEVDEPDELDRFINELKEELVLQADGYFFCKNEGTFVRYRRQGDHWEGTLPDGTRLLFGLTPEGRVEDLPTGRIFSWLLERKIDTRGNTTVYRYRSFPGGQNARQKYLSEIAYGAGPSPWANFHFVFFAYEDRTDWFEDGRAGFLVRTGRRLKEIVVATQGPTLAGHLAGDFNQDGTTDYLVRKYALGYVPSSPWSLLSQIVPVGADGLGALPPVRFGYTRCDPPETLSATGQIVGGLDEPPHVMDNALVDLIDLNADGLPDVLKTESWGGAHIGFLNLGEDAGAAAIRWSPPRTVASGDGLAWNVNLESQDSVAHFADMNGDGLADLVQHSGDGSVYYFPNAPMLTTSNSPASPGWGRRHAFSVLDFAPPSPFGADLDVRTADLDFDKRIDIVQSIPVAGGVDYRIWFNRGQQRYAYSQTMTAPRGFLFSQPGVHIADFNGDRVPDIVSITPAELIVTAGLGHGTFAAPMTVVLAGFTLDSEQLEKATLQDVTGDGLVDLVVERAAPGELWYWLNLGNYSLSARRKITGLPANFAQSTAIRWADLNGNGTLDMIYADSSSTPRLRTLDLGRLLGCVPRAHLLTTIDNGLGREIGLSYATSTAFALADAAAGRPWPYSMPFPVTVVASATIRDWRGQAYISQFQYHDGYYDAAEREFRGFGCVEQIELGDVAAPSLVTRSLFDVGRTDEPMKGKLLGISAEQKDGGIFWTEETAWTIPTLYTGVTGQAVRYAHPHRRVRTILEGGQGTARRLESEYAYDRYGNQTTNAEYGIVVGSDRSAFNDERITVTEYAVNLSAWILRLPSRQVRMDENGAVSARIESFYDDETFSAANLGSVSVGNLTLRRQWSDPSDPSAVISVSRARYDAYGNATTFLDPLGAVTGGSANLTAGHVREVVYDLRFHAYPLREIVHVGGGQSPLVMEVDYDFGFGKITASRDFNGNQTSYGYDNFARLIRVIRPGDTAEYPTLEYDYVLGLPTGSNALVNYIETRRLDKVPPPNPASRLEAYFISRQFIDGLGRALMTKMEDEPSASGAPRVLVKDAVLFNGRAQVAQTLNSFHTVAAGTTLSALLSFEDVNAPGWQGSFHENGQMRPFDLVGAHRLAIEYDATLRPIKTIHQDGAFRRIVHEPLLIRTYDENDTDPASPHFDTPTAQRQDGLGRQIGIEETTRLSDDGQPGGERRTWLTQFGYNVNDHLVRVTDSQNNVRVLTNDALGRLTFLNDPDRGMMRYIYDAASNLIETRDAKGQRITRSYDGANRILTEDFHDGQPSPSWRGIGNTPDVIYHYDSPMPDLDPGDGTTATARNTKGCLAWVEDLSGEEHTSFDSRGRAEYMVKRVADPVHGHLVAFTTRWAY